ncbi:MAG TPA: carbohydrate ABC transporter permease [Acetobacteraceae bacterium]|jgi:multiple sugar transport system permease protein|nr:carbohydrate ABC transporter permease [Acetobacteraceae bacterium]
MPEVAARTPLARSWSLARHLGICAVAASFLFPFGWMVSTALRTDREVFAIPPKLLPEQVQWHNFVDAWEYLPFGTFFLNSAFVAASVTAIVLVVSSLAGYAFARLRFRGRTALFLLYLATLMVPQAVIVIPLFLMMSALGWVDSYKALIIPVAFSSFGTFLLRQFFLTVPQELEDAARIDGASHLRILLTVFLPLSMPAIGLLALFTFTGQWNSFLWPLIAINGPEHATLPLGLTMFQGQQGTQWTYMMAGATISMAPGLLLTLLLHRYIFAGIAVGSGFGGR